MFINHNVGTKSKLSKTRRLIATSQSAQHWQNFNMHKISLIIRSFFKWSILFKSIS